MTSEQKLAHLRAWSESLQASDNNIQPVIDLMRLSGDDPVTRVVWGLQSDLTRVYSSLVGDEVGWLSWFAADNDFGRKSFEAGPVGSERPIRSLEDLLWVIEA